MNVSQVNYYLKVNIERIHISKKEYYHTPI
jgi:hypothetical protein